MKKLLLFIAGLALMLNAEATHFSGGEIRYEYNGTDYDVYLTLYKVCQSSPGAPLPTQVAVQVISASQSINFSDSLTFIGFDTIAINCPNSSNFCYNPTGGAGTLPGYIQAKFKGTVTLPSKATDWIISWTNCCRIVGILNCGAGEDFYIETWLDNTTALNSNPRMVAAPSYYLSVNDTAFIPLQTIDPEGDSIAYRMVKPRSSAIKDVVYTSAYTFTNPMGTGGICKIDPATHMLIVKPVTQGMFAIAFSVDEYRNGVKIGSYVRDIMFAVVPSTSKLSFPQQSTGNPKFVYTCSGQTSNTVVLNYVDPSVTDSVYVDVEFPNLSGWGFTAVTNNGTPNASTSITWSTPGGLNPATLPHFYIKVKAKDNACPGSTAEYSLLVRTRQCVSDSVWPGDANGDFTVNIYDPLAIAIAAGKTGPTRTGANITWTAQACTNWANSFVTNNTNMKHADCNGDGTVNNTDLAAVTANYSLSHPKGGQSKTTGSNDLYFDMTGLRIAPNRFVSIPIKFGSPTQTVNNVYGIATQILIDGLPLTTAPTVSNNGSWLDNSSSAINFSYGVNPNAVDWALGRTNQQNASGQGVIGTLDFMVPANAVVGDNVTFSFANTFVIDRNGNEHFDINPIEEKVLITKFLDVASVAGEIKSVSIVPNPSFNRASLNMVLDEDAAVNVAVLDITGKTVWSTSGNYSRGNQQIALPAGQIANGMYMVQLSTDGARASVMKWVKQ